MNNDAKWGFDYRYLYKKMTPTKLIIGVREVRNARYVCIYDTKFGLSTSEFDFGYFLSNIF